MKQRRIEKEMYLNGTKNRFVILYFYLKAGLVQANEFKYVGALIIALFALLKIESYFWMVWMAMIAIPLITVAGGVWVRFMAKQLEYFERRQTTYWAMYQVNLAEKTNKLLEKLLKKDLQKKN